MAGIIELKNVSFTAQNMNIVSDFSFMFEEGKTTAIIGPSGSGKSTVLKLAAGLLVPAAGEINFRGKDVFTMSRQENLDFRREAAMVFQDSALWANQNLYQILELPLRTHFPNMPPAERNDRIKEVLKQVGYKRDTTIRPSQLSMGEQKLIGFARALMCRPKLLFLDEWTESMDESAVQKINRVLYNHIQAQNTVIFVSHDLRFIKTLADTIILMTEGKYADSFFRGEIDNDEDLAQYLEKGKTREEAKPEAQP